MPRTFKVLELSTDHLPAYLRDTLSSEDGVITHRHESDDDRYGWWVWVPDDPDEHNAGYWEFPEKLAVVQRYARRNDCDWILFDRDAEINDELPTFDE